MAVIGYIFPGPSACSVGMGSALYNAMPGIRAALDQADRAFKDATIDYKVTKAAFVGPDEKLADAGYGGPALLAFSWGLVQTLREKHVTSQMMGGFGYGDILAMVAGRVLDFEQALFFLHKRGQLLQPAWRQFPFHVLTVFGLPEEALDKLIVGLEPHPSIVGRHGPEAATLAGEKPLLEKLAVLLKSKKIRVSPVVPGYDWPHPMFKPVAEKVAELFSELKLERSGNIEIFNSVTGEVVRKLEEYPDLIARGCYEPVDFASVVASMRGRGMNTAVEIGHGNTLGSFISAIDNGIRVLYTEDPKAFSHAVKLAN